MINIKENRNVKFWPSDGSVTLSFRSRSLKFGSFKFLNLYYHDTKGEYSTLKLVKRIMSKNNSIHLRWMLISNPWQFAQCINKKKVEDVKLFSYKLFHWMVINWKWKVNFCLLLLVIIFLATSISLQFLSFFSTCFWKWQVHGLTTLKNLVSKLL